MTDRQDDKAPLRFLITSSTPIGWRSRLWSSPMGWPSAAAMLTRLIR